MAEHEHTPGMAFLRAAYEATAALRDGSDANDILSTLASSAAGLFGSQAASILVRDRLTDTLRFGAAFGPASERLRNVNMPHDAGIAGHVLRRGVPLVLDNACDDPRFFGDLDAQTGFRTRDLACVPLRFEERVVGVMQVINRGRAFGEDDLLALRFYANLAGAALADQLVSCGNVFTLRDAAWHIRYVGDAAPENGTWPERAGVGLRYYHALISQAGVEIDAADLVRGDSAPPPASNGCRATFSFQATADDRARHDVRTQLATIDDPADSTEGRQLQAYLDDASRPGARSSRLGPRSDAERAREAVRIALTRTRKRLSERMPRLSGHLAESVSVRGTSFCYDPHEPSAWDAGRTPA